MEKTIEGFPKYTVDEKGVVRRLRDGKEIAQQIYCGYKCVALWNNGKSKWEKVHRLVAKAFIENPDNLPCVNHKDEDKLNNDVANLEWCNHKYNNEYGKNAPLLSMIEARKRRVVQIDKKGNEVARFESAKEAERKTGIHQSNISKCCLGRTNYVTAGGYFWKFEK